MLAFGVAFKAELCPNSSLLGVWRRKTKYLEGVWYVTHRKNTTIVTAFIMQLSNSISYDIGCPIGEGRQSGSVDFLCMVFNLDFHSLCIFLDLFNGRVSFPVLHLLYYSARKKHEIMPFPATWMDLDISILSEINQRQVSCGI